MNEICNFHNLPRTINSYTYIPNLVNSIFLTKFIYLLMRINLNKFRFQ